MNKISIMSLNKDVSITDFFYALGSIMAQQSTSSSPQPESRGPSIIQVVIYY